MVHSLMTGNNLFFDFIRNLVPKVGAWAFEDPNPPLHPPDTGDTSYRKCYGGFPFLSESGEQKARNPQRFEQSPAFLMDCVFSMSSMTAMSSTVASLYIS